MKTLIVMRHAKSDWSATGTADIDRTLNKRGRTSAKAIGVWLTAGGFVPDVVLCSSARRTAETWENMGLSADIHYLRELYLAAPATILDTVRAVKRDSVMVLAHNPGIAAFAEAIVANAPDHDRFYDYPTAATLVAEFDGDWSELAPGKAIARAFTVPRDLVD